MVDESANTVIDEGTTNNGGPGQYNYGWSNGDSSQRTEPDPAMPNTDVGEAGAGGGGQQGEDGTTPLAPDPDASTDLSETEPVETMQSETPTVSEEPGDAPTTT